MINVFRKIIKCARRTRVENNVQVILVFIKINKIYTVILADFRRRLTVRITELEDTCEQLRIRCNGLEKTKNKLTAEIREITIELENVCKTILISIINS